MPFTEVAERVWVARYPGLELNITLIAGERGPVVVDTHASEQAGRALVEEIRALGLGPPVAAVNTHEHYDHVFGNAALKEAFPDLPIHATEEAAERTIAAGQRMKEVYRDHPDDPDQEAVLATRIVPADHTFSSAAVLDLGDRVVELVHPGRGHTGGDLVVRVPDADVLVAGDLLEESGPPAYGDDCFPLDWPSSLDFMHGLLTGDTVVVPGHGALVDLAFVAEQRDAIGTIAETIRDLAGQGVRPEDALAQAEWPFPAEHLERAVRRGFAQLPRGERRLPLV